MRDKCHWGENSVRLLLTAALVLMLSSLAFAATETRQLGPYTVSFDMNTPMPYEVQVQEPIETDFASAYPMVIVTDNTTGARIFVTEYKNLTDSTLATSKNIVRLTMLLRGFNVTGTNDMTIDGKEGFLVTGENSVGPSPVTFNEAMYWLDSVNCECGPVSVGRVNVDMTSTYPQDVTQGILNSLHVTTGQAPAMAAPAMAGQMPSQAQMTQEMPPVNMSQQPPQ